MKITANQIFILSIGITAILSTILFIINGAIGNLLETLKFGILAILLSIILYSEIILRRINYAKKKS